MADPLPRSKQLEAYQQDGRAGLVPRWDPAGREALEARQILVRLRREESQIQDEGLARRRRTAVARAGAAGLCLAFLLLFFGAARILANSDANPNLLFAGIGLLAVSGSMMLGALRPDEPGSLFRPWG